MVLKKEVLIVGGGFAGLAAGVELVSRGHAVTLIEKKSHLGGRAYSYKDPISGSTLDNGQHVLMGCYRDTIDFLDRIGCLDRVQFQKNLSVDFAAPGSGLVPFRCPPLPAPWNLLAGFLGFRGLSIRERLSVLKVGGAVRSGKNDAQLDRLNVTEWLTSLGQSPRVQERFWNPLAFAALNDCPERSSAALMKAVLREALFSGRKASRIGIPRVGLSDLYTDAARDYIERKGGHFLLQAPVVRFHFRGREFSEAELEGGRRVSAEVLLVTTPFTALRRLLPDWMLYEDPFFLPLSRLSTSPIVSIHLWFDREVTDRTFIGLWGTRVHWIFNKGKILGDQPGYLSLVISGARQELQMPAAELSAIAMEELRSVLPAVREAKLLRTVVTKEPEATMAPAPGAALGRLPQKTPYQNFYLAGDWTDTGLPATIESAVRSAKRAVELIDVAG